MHDVVTVIIICQLNSQRLINEGSKVPLHSPSVILDQQGKLYPVLFLSILLICQTRQIKHSFTLMNSSQIVVVMLQFKLKSCSLK